MNCRVAGESGERTEPPERFFGTGGDTVGLPRHKEKMRLHPGHLVERHVGEGEDCGKLVVNQRHLIQSPSAVRPHVVLLGAGASLDAFPDGDASGHRVPLMHNLVDVVGLRSLIARAAAELHNEKNFEEIYSTLATTSRYGDLVKDIENKIDAYFSSLKIPKETTKYDYLILSLREKDAIFTFNWDPFLFDVYRRNSHIASLPKTFFLHGNVRIGICPNHPEVLGERRGLCSICSKRLEDVPLLYPIGKKDYSSHEYIRGSWEAARYFFEEAFVLTIFGYGAPVSDADAVDLLRSGWIGRSDRKIEHVEIVDVVSSSVLYERWRDFTPTGHLKPICSIWDSWIMMHPRRSVESLMRSVYCGEPSGTFPLVTSARLQRVHEQILDIAAWEGE